MDYLDGILSQPDYLDISQPDDLLHSLYVSDVFFKSVYSGIFIHVLPDNVICTW